MAVTPVDKEPNTISMVVENWKSGQVEQISPVHLINGFPWRLRLSDGGEDLCNLSLICDKPSEAELWRCRAKLIAEVLCTRLNTMDFCATHTHTFTSWNKESQEFSFGVRCFTVGNHLTVTIETEDDGESWGVFPTLNPLEPCYHYGVLVIGNEKKKIQVNKEFLASQSPYFERLFNGDFKEKSMNEIPIGDVEYEDFSNLVKMVCGFAGAALTDANVIKAVELADRFELKIVEHKATAFILSSSSLSLQQKLLISEKYNIPFIKEAVLSQKYTLDQLKEMNKSPVWNQLSQETLGVLYDMVLKHVEIENDIIVI